MQCSTRKKDDHNQKIEEKTKRLFPFEDFTTNSQVKKFKIHTNQILNMETSPACKHNFTKHLTNKVQSLEISNKEYIPLMEKLRPINIATYIGQKQVIGPNTVLSNLLEKKEIPSMIFWGPHGCGKTSLTNVITCLSKETGNDVHIINLSAANSGVKNIREAVTAAKDKSKLGCKTIVFMDEIHRFNKLQQDIFLPHVEAGTFILIGCTTENPSYSLNSALLSRCRVFMLSKLTESNISEILYRAIEYMKGCIFGTRETKQSNNREQNDCNPNLEFNINNNTVQWLAEACDGDARVALTTLELAVLARRSDKSKISWNNSVIITLKDIQENLVQMHILSDKESDQSHHMYSALHKSIKAGKVNASLYWMARIMAVKEDPVNIARRLVRISSEDIGLADPDALGIAVHTMHGCQMIGMPECDVLLGQCTVYLAKAPKSRLIYNALKAAKKVISEHKGPQPTVPLHVRCNLAEVKLQNSIDYTNNLIRQEDYNISYLPKELQHINFFQEKLPGNL